jgi:hypothetical protein
MKYEDEFVKRLGTINTTITIIFLVELLIKVIV